MLAMKQTATFIEIVDTLPRHTALMRDNLRKEDADEILRLGISIEKCLWHSYKKSIYRKTAFIDGRIAAMWGCIGGMFSDVGTVWLLTTPEVYRISPLRFCRMYQQEVEKMLKIFPKLTNYVDAEYSTAIRLLDNSGFTLYDAEQIGFSGHSYRKFEIGKI